MEKGLLDGVVVLDLTRVLAGPYCGMILADMGATVIKLENPKGGDDTRKMGPFINENSVYYANFNRSKLGCTLNLKDPDAKAMFLELVKKYDGQIGGVVLDDGEGAVVFASKLGTTAFATGESEGENQE